MKLQFNVQMSRQYLFDFFSAAHLPDPAWKTQPSGRTCDDSTVCAYLEPGGKNVQRVLYIFCCIFPAPDAGKLWIKADQGFKEHQCIVNHLLTK